MSGREARLDLGEHESDRERLLNGLLDQLEAQARMLVDQGAGEQVRRRLERVLGEGQAVGSRQSEIGSSEVAAAEADEEAPEPGAEIELALEPFLRTCTVKHGQLRALALALRRCRSDAERADVLAAKQSLEEELRAMFGRWARGRRP